MTEGDITRVERKVDALVLSTGGIREDIARLTTIVSDAVVKANNHENILRGEGTVPGLVSDVRANCEAIEDMEEILYGKDKKGGLVQVVDTLEKIRANAWKVVLAFILALSSGAAAYLISLWVK